MKFSFLLFYLFTFISTLSFGQAVKHTYRFYDDLQVAKPECGPDLVASRAPGSCGAGATGGSYVSDVLPCSVRRTVYRNNTGWGLSYPNPGNVISDTYTIQMYVRVLDWNKDWMRIIDFSNGLDDEGIYFHGEGNDQFVFDIFPFGIAPGAQLLSTSSYYLVTFTRSGVTGMFEVYLNGTLYLSFNDVDGRYVAKANTPISLFRDDGEAPNTSCESGQFNVGYVSFSNEYSTRAQVAQSNTDICATANINPNADFAIIPNPACGEPYNIEIEYTGPIPDGAAGFSYAWDWGGGKAVSGSGRGPFMVTWNSPGEKHVTLRVTNAACNNTITNIKQVIISDLAVNTTLVPGNCATSTPGKLTVTGQKGAAPYQYSLDSVTFQTTNTFEVQPADYTVFVKDANGCVVKKPVTVESSIGLEVETIADATICAGQMINLTTTSNATAFSWSPLVALDNAGAQSPWAMPTSTTTYIVLAQQGSCSVRDTVTITVTDQIELVVTPNTTINAGVPFQLSVSSPQLPNPAAATYQWSPPEGLNDPTSNTPIATLDTDQTYNVQVSAGTDCKASGAVTLTVQRNEGISVPTAFTPDGDGKNEILSPILRGISSIKFFRVYNRWGEVVFSTDEVDQGWDGRYKGLLAANGSYVWEIEGVSGSGKTIRKKGAVMLIR